MFSAQAISNFLISLEIMGLGLAGIFIVMLIIMLMISLLSKIKGKE